MSIKRLILNPITLAAFLVMFLVSGPEMDLFKSGPSLVEDAEASGDKDKDDDEITYTYNAALNETYDCSSLEKLQITYHEDFDATENASGPNVLVTGSDSSTCTVVIIKESGGENCGFNVDTSDSSKLVITTNVINSATDCEMCIQATVPRNTKIKG